MKNYSFSAFYAVLAALAFLLLVIPAMTLLAEALTIPDWHVMLQSQVIWQAAGLSISTTLVATCISVLLGTPLAWVLTRWRFPARRWITLLIELPVVMPPAVAGLALLLTFGRQGLIGSTLSAAGISIPFTTLAVVLVQIFVGMPLYIRAAQLGFGSVSQELEDAARIDGASEGQVFRSIVFPLALRALLVGGVTCWARGMGEFGATMLFAGSLPGRTQTLPLLVYTIFERDLQAAIWTGALLLGIALAVIALGQWLLADAGRTDHPSA